MLPVLKDMFKLFYSYREHWSSAVTCIAQLDAFISIAKFSKSFTRPQFSETPLILKGMKHPYLEQIQENSIDLDQSILITGANMGGKSTLLKTLCLNVILAQIGSYVPCQYYNGLVIKKIYSRIGAYDNIL